MKQVIIVMGLAVIMVLMSAIIIMDNNDTDREDELNRAVSAAVKQTVAESQITSQNTITSDEEMVAEFINILSVTLESSPDLEIQIMGVDCEKGLLDVLVTESYDYVNGQTGSISVRKCAIYQ